MAIPNEQTNTSTVTDAAEIRKAEVYALASVEDCVTHTTPEVMETNCQYICDWDAEIAELTRVCKSGGWLLDCPGDETPDNDRGNQQDELVKRGWEKMQYIGNGSGNVYRYRRQVWKG